MVCFVMPHSLDPDADPLGVLLMIDYYALKSEQYHFLRRLYDEWEVMYNIVHKHLIQINRFHRGDKKMTFL